MELIKKLKKTEAEAKELVEQAKAEAAKMGQEARQARSKAMHEAELERKKAIEEAEKEAESAGAGEAANMKAEAQEAVRHLNEQARGRMEQAVQKVMDYLKG